MPLQQLIKISFIALIFLTAQKSWGQNQDSVSYIKSPYRAEYTPHFKLGVYKRGFATDSLKMSLDSLDQKPRGLWSRRDSLVFAEASLKTGNIKLSEYYFNHLNVDFDRERRYWYDQLMIYYLKKDFEAGVKEITTSSPMILEFSDIYFYKKIFEAQVQQKKDPKWYETNIVFDWTIDTAFRKMDKRSEEFQIAVAQPLKHLEFVLQHIVAFVHEDDPVLASSFREMGHIIHGYFNLSHAYMAYSIGRHYNKRDKALLADLKYLKSLLTKKKYKIPNFRRYFPRIEKWKFEYAVLKEQVILEQNDTTEYIKPQTMKAKEPPLISFPHQLIVIGGLAFIMLLLIFLLRTKKS